MGEPITDAVLAEPAPRLRGLVDQYIGYRYEGFEPGLHRGLPSRQLTFIISLGDPVEMAALPDPRQAPTAMRSFVSGLASSPAMIRHDGNQFGIALELTPLGARMLFGMPAAALASIVVELRDVLGSPTTELMDRLTAASDWSTRFGVLDDVLSRVVRDTATTPPPEVVHAWNCLVATDGTIGVNALATEVGWSRRHLSGRFRDELGLSPKVMGRVMRFERARQLLVQPDRPNLADVAAACNYYDQAHMNREWNEFAGCSPTLWMAEELPSIQDTLATAGTS
jgi:AraC-like DNA-binding protein